jgi:succinate dehydrogenase/fumarate reductase flavoprotein subunit
MPLPQLPVGTQQTQGKRRRVRRTETWDTIVVGGGAAGLAAAITAATPNGRVLLLEKCLSLGGSTALAIGSVTASGSRLQKTAEIEDSTQDFFEDVGRAIGELGFAGRDNEELRRVLVHEAGASVKWLESLGASFLGPFPEDCHRVPRMHNILPNAWSYIALLRRAARKSGVEIRTESPVIGLMTSGDKVIGVRVDSGKGARSTAASAVVLATGDYSANSEMKRRYMGEEFAQVDGVNPATTGDGHRMAMDVGAAVNNMDLSIGPSLRFVYRPRPLWVGLLLRHPGLTKPMAPMAKLFPRNLFRLIAKGFLGANTSPSVEMFKKGAILVNQEGKRFTNELQKAAGLAVAVSRQPGKIAYILFDAVLARVFSRPPHAISTAPGLAYAYFNDYLAIRKDLTHSGRNVYELAARLNVDPVTLNETVSGYNGFIAAGKDPDFGRDTPAKGFQQPPFHALGPLKGYFSSVEGGLTVDTRCRVLSIEGNAIPGLYAAGAVGQDGLILAGHGLHIAWALVSGRIAGETAKEARRGA